MRGTSSARPAPSEEIRASWARSRGYGLSRRQPLDDLPISEVDTGSALVSAAEPILERVAARLQGTGYVLLLADQDGKVIGRYGRSLPEQRWLEDCSAQPGVSFSEEHIGTNAIGTVLETRRPVRVGVGEHFNVALRPLACLGVPVFHPVTRRLLGVVDLSGDDMVTHSLGAGLVRDVVSEIETAVLASSRAAHQRLYAAFRANSQARRPVLAVDQDVLLANRQALDLLDPSDITALHGRVREEGSRQGGSFEVTLASGSIAPFQASVVPGTHRGLLITMLQEPRPTARRASAVPAMDASRTVRATAAVVCGPPGSGRTRTALQIAGPSRVVLACRSASAPLEQDWLRRLSEALDRAPASLVVEELDQLSVTQLLCVADLLDDAAAPRVVLTAAPSAELVGRAAVLARRCHEQIEIAPLRDRPDEIPDLARAMLAELAPGTSLRLTPSVLEALRAGSWQGELHELRTVLEQVARTRSAGDVTLPDLPAAYRSPPPALMGGLERAERGAIVLALERHGGNKRQAAAELGISRTTLYSRIRQLRIPT